MRRHSQREVEAAAQRRLELLRRELEQAGLDRLDDHRSGAGKVEAVPGAGGSQASVRSRPEPAGADPPVAEEPVLPEAAPVSPPGRHARPGRRSLAAGLADRASGAVADRLPETFRGRAGLQAGPALLVVALVATAVLAGVVVLARSGAQSQPVPAPRPAAPATAPRTSPVPGPSGAPSARASGGSITVDVTGKVRRPGVTTLPAGSRVIDALKHAGGARGGTDLTGLNLARVLVDGEQIVVGRPPVPGGVAAGVASGAPPPTGALVNLNTATQEELETLPGVGPVTAQKILQWRTDHGAFSAVDELLEIDGIGEKTFADLAPLVTL